MNASIQSAPRSRPRDEVAASAGDSISPRLPIQDLSLNVNLPCKREPTVLAAAAAADGIAAGDSAASATRTSAISPALAVLLAGHVLRDGEIIQLIVKPSLWFIPFQSVKFAAGMAVLGMASSLWLPPGIAWYYIEAAIFLTAGRLMWATLHWINRLYVLTDMRVLRLGGIFTIEIFDCPLRRVGVTRIVLNVRERLMRLGTIEIHPNDEDRQPGFWQTVRKPLEVNELIQAAVAKAKSGGL